MSSNFFSPQQQALEACIRDAVAFMDMYLQAYEHPKAALIFNGIIAHASMFVLESHRCLITLIPDTKLVFASEHSELLRQSRHRAKLLDDSEKTIEEVIAELVSIARRQREIFLESHKGILGPLKRALQPDIGLSVYDDHIFTTTHTVVFESGKEKDFSESAYAFGEEIGAYIATLFSLFQIELPSSATKPADLPGIMGMRDIKYETLYNRSPLDATQMEISAGLILILANLNFVIYILAGLLPENSHLLFRMKFITAFHANSSLLSLQRIVMTSKSPPAAIALFKEALGNSDSRWLRKRRPLRNLLTHYLPDDRLTNEIRPNATRVQALEHYGAGLSFAEMNNLLDRNINHLSCLIENFFNPSGDPFWLGTVK